MRPFPIVRLWIFSALFLGFLAFHAAANTYYVDINSPSPTPPYTSWSTASTDIQSAINVATNGDLILVNDGVYQTGGETVNGFGLTNRLAIIVPVTVQSVNGPATTMIEGYQDTNSTVAYDAVRCVYLTSHAVLSGFTLTNGATLASGDGTNEQSGGGAFCECTNAVITNCVVTANAANNEGGGIYGGTLADCTFLNNYTEGNGGGAAQGNLNGCLLNGNTAGIDGGAVMAGALFNCTLTNNYAPANGGGAESSTLDDCTMTGNSAGFYGGGADSSILSQCILVSNLVNGDLQSSPDSQQFNPGPLLNPSGGGAENSVLNHCTLTGNQAVGFSNGGGADSSELTNCMLVDNVAGANGGGVNSSYVADCVLTNNSASYFGGGAEGSTLTDCALAFNSCGYNGGGADGSTLINSVVYENTAGTAGGVNSSILVNSTVVANSGVNIGGASYCYLVNCIVYFNSISQGIGQPNYDSYCTLEWCDASPLSFGTNNIAVNPELADFEHIAATSPCRGAGEFAAASGVDIDGQPWLNPPSIGCDEYYAGAVTGPLSVSARASYTNLVAGFTANFSGSVIGNASYNTWNFGDGTVITNSLFASHSWNAGGNYTVTFTAYNNDNPGGVSATVMIFVTAQEVYYVSHCSTNPISPFSTWNTAATNIQDAVDASFPGGTVLVTNGIYQCGGETEGGFNLTNRVVIDKPVTVQSVNGPLATIIGGVSAIGDDAIRCAYLTNGAMLAGFTLTNGATLNGGDGVHEQSGGGALCESDAAVISNCVVSGSAATYYGGGVYQGTLEDCFICSNEVTYYGNGTGGGVDSAILIGCTLSNNLSYIGGGAENSTLLNCCVVSNYTYIDDDYTANGGGVANSWLTNCVLSGNASLTGGGASSSTLVNCALIENSTLLGDGVWPPTGGGAYNSTLLNCMVISNTAINYGGGAEGGTLQNCTLTANTATADSGGGADSATLYNCALLDNSAQVAGGGANNSTLYNCGLTNNFSITYWPDGVGGGANNSTLNNCALTGNYAEYTGGGAFGSTLVNCTLTGNAAYFGGAANSSTLYNCLIIGNEGSSGAVYLCTSYNCTLSGNSSAGAQYGTLNNCICYYNDVNSVASTLNFCCTTPLPIGSFGNITNAPLFVNAAAGNYQLQSNSPCINAGNNAYFTTSTDLAGNPRIVGGTVDVGAYEYQTPTSVISYAWLQQYDLPTDGSVDFTNLDGTAFNVYEDWAAGLNPTNPACVLVMLAPTATINTNGVTVTWQSVSGITYFLQSSTNLLAQPAFNTIATGITGQTNTTSYTDTTATGNVPYFYRVGVTAP